MPAAAEPSRRLAANLRWQMCRRGLLPGGLAARAEVELGDLTAILHGERPVHLDTLLKLAGALEVRPEDLLDGIRWVPDGSGGGRYEMR